MLLLLFQKRFFQNIFRIVNYINQNIGDVYMIINQKIQKNIIESNPYAQNLSPYTNLYKYYVFFRASTLFNLSHKDNAQHPLQPHSYSLRRQPHIG